MGATVVGIPASTGRFEFGPFGFFKFIGPDLGFHKRSICRGSVSQQQTTGLVGGVQWYRENIHDQHVFSNSTCNNASVVVLVLLILLVLLDLFVVVQVDV